MASKREKWLVFSTDSDGVTVLIDLATARSETLAIDEVNQGRQSGTTSHATPLVAYIKHLVGLLALSDAEVDRRWMKLIRG